MNVNRSLCHGEAPIEGDHDPGFDKQKCVRPPYHRDEVGEEARARIRITLSAYLTCCSQTTRLLKSTGESNAELSFNEQGIEVEQRKPSAVKPHRPLKFTIEMGRERNQTAYRLIVTSS